MALSAALHELCLTSVEVLPFDGAVIHLMATESVIGVAAASGPEAAAVGDLPFVTGVGPCLDAHRMRRPVLIPDLGAVAARWPGYADAMLAHGMSAVSSLPLGTGALGLGVLDLYAATPGSLDQRELASAMSMGRLATDLLLTGGVGPGELVGEVVDHRAEIYQAQGALVVALGVPLAEAMVRMRAHAFVLDVPLLELARMVLGFETVPEEW